MTKKPRISNNQPNYLGNLPREVLLLVLLPFQQNEASVFVSLVCKSWQSIIKRKSISTKSFVSYYVLYGSVNSLKLVRQFISDDSKFFITPLFSNSSTLQWALNELLVNINTKPRLVIKSAALALAKSGHLSYLISLHCHRPLIKTFPLLKYAASGGHLDILIWIKDNIYWPTNSDFEIISKICFSAAKHGHLHIVQYLGDCFDLKEAVYGAAYGGQIEVLKWTLKLSIWCPHITYYAAKGGHLAILKWLKQEGFELDEETSEGAAEGGHLELLNWLEQSGIQLSTDLCLYAARGGNLDLVKHLQGKGYELPRTLSTVIRGSTLECIKYLHGQGCEWDILSTVLAAQYGHADILQYAIESSCALDSMCLISAVKQGHLEVVKLLIKHKANDIGASTEAAKNGDLEILKVLYENDYKITENAWGSAASNRDLEMLKWLHNIGCRRSQESSQKALMAAVNGKYLDVLEFLKKYGFASANQN